MANRYGPKRTPEEKAAAHRAANLKWRLAHPERAREKSRAGHAKFRDRERTQARAWRAAHPERVREKNIEWRVKHPEYDAAWWRAHPEKRVAKTARRRAAKYAQRCSCCSGAQIEAVYAARRGGEVDHIVPLVLGGHHCVKNLQALTYRDHREKTKQDQRAIAEAKRRSKLLRGWPAPDGELPLLFSNRLMAL
jgi:5-methylcytosine-specific restriction endonuclease McrA